jgi:hypothetical protein
VVVLGMLWRAWKALAMRVGHFQSRLLLVVLYFVVVGPIALIVQLASDPLGVKTSGWTERRRATSLEAARRQF